MLDEIKSDDLFDALADEMEQVYKSLKDGERGEYKIPPLGDIEALWYNINKELGNTDNMKKHDFVVKKCNEFYFVGMYLKAAKVMGLSKRDQMLTRLSDSYALADSKKSFIRTSYKLLKKKIRG